jgi:hypothetical protein
MIKTEKCILSLLCLTVLLLFSSQLPLASAGTNCPCDDLDTCIEWVSDGSVSVKWGQVETVEIGGEYYTFRADDFDKSLESALISIERDGIVRKEFLFLEGSDEDSWLDWDNEVKVEISGISVDSYKTPSASLKLYSRGLPELEIEFDASTETVDSIEVSSKQYAPGEEKQIDVTVKNTGDAWIENVVLKIDTGEMRVRSKEEFEYRDGILKENLGCLEVGDSVEMNFTVVAPEWDGVTSPYDLTYFVNATAGGYDIKDDYFDANESISFECTDPELIVTMEIVNDEINMSTWYVKQLEKSTGTSASIDYEIRGADEYSLLRTRVFNMGLYAIDEMNVQFSVIPDDLIISEMYESGDYSSMETDGQYYIGQKLVPVSPGKYTFDAVIVTANFFGKTYSWKSGSESLTVHGPHIILEKKLTNSNSDYTVTLGLSNDGDRASWINLTDTIPDNVNYVGGSLEKGLEGSDLPLSEWDLSTKVVNGTQIVSVKGVMLPPGSSLSMSYEFSSNEAPDLPAAVCEFKSIWDYEGEVQSSYYVSGAEVKQYWKPLSGGWVTESKITETSVVPTVVEEEPEVIDVSEEDTGEELNSVDDELPNTSDVVLEVETESSTSFLSKILSPISSMFDKVQQFVSNTFGGALSGVASIFGMAESAAVGAVENYLYAVVIGIALVVFLVVSTLISK